MHDNGDALTSALFQKPSRFMPNRVDVSDIKGILRVGREGDVGQSQSPHLMAESPPDTGGLNGVLVLKIEEDFHLFLVEDGDGMRAADAGGSGIDEIKDLSPGVNAARGLETQGRTDGRAHEFDVFDLGAAGAEAR